MPPTAVVYPETFSFDSESFSLVGRKANNTGWYEFGSYIGGQEFKSIGGEEITICLRRLLSILRKKKGKRLSEIEGVAPFEELVGSDTDYIGYLVFSGYNTLYFFRVDEHLKHVVLADSRGKLLAHSILKPELEFLWLTRLSDLGIQ